MQKDNHLGSKSEITRFESVVCGGISGLVARFVIAPLDVVKIRLQLQGQNSASLHTMRAIIRNEGFRALWKGNIPAEAMYVCYGAVQFTTYKQINRLCNSYWDNDSATAFISGAGAGVVATSVTYPMDLLRTRFAAQYKNTKTYRSLAHAVGQIYRTENGITGLFRGLGPTIYSIVPYMGLFFASYGNLRKVMARTPQLDYMPAPDAIAGFMAGMFSKTVVFPFDVIRKRFQVQGPEMANFVPANARHKSAPYSSASIWRSFAHIVKIEGIRGLYRGYFVSLIKNAPFTAVTVYTFERSLSVVRYLEGRPI